MRPLRIAFIGFFGYKNLGNECTLEAIIHHAKKRVPGSTFICISKAPDDTHLRHKIPAFPLTTRNGNMIVHHLKGGRPHGIVELFRKKLETFWKEVLHWAMARNVLAKVDMLIVPGTQFLSDHLTDPLGWPYDLFKWSILAKLRRCRLLFVSIGVGPLNHPLSRWLVKTALSFGE